MRTPYANTFLVHTLEGDVSERYRQTSGARNGAGRASRVRCRYRSPAAAIRLPRLAGRWHERFPEREARVLRSVSGCGTCGSLQLVELGQVAQSVEQRTENPRVGSSILPLAIIAGQ
jgi:hypothetical protein